MSLVPMFLALTFDKDAEAEIATLTGHIEAAGIPTSYNTPHFKERMLPHITLGGYDVEAPEAWLTPLAAVAAGHSAFAVELHSLGLFPEAGVVYLAPRISRELIELRHAVLAIFEKAGATPRSANLDANRFNPHCTLVPSSAGDATLRAIDTCRQHWHPINALATALCLIVPPDPRPRGQLLLAGNPSSDISHRS